MQCVLRIPQTERRMRRSRQGWRLTLGVEVRASLGASHGQRGQSIFKDLLKGQELHDGKVDRGVEADATL